MIKYLIRFNLNVIHTISIIAIPWPYERILGDWSTEAHASDIVLMQSFNSEKFMVHIWDL